MITPTWNTINEPLYPWVQTIERIVCAENLPMMSGADIYIMSDYSGDSKASKFNVISVLYMDFRASMAWEVKRRAVRRLYLSDGRRISFKSLGDRQRQKALIPFLEA